MPRFFREAELTNPFGDGPCAGPCAGGAGELRTEARQSQTLVSRVIEWHERAGVGIEGPRQQEISHLRIAGQDRPVQVGSHHRPVTAPSVPEPSPLPTPASPGPGV